MRTGEKAKTSNWSSSNSRGLWPAVVADTDPEGQRSISRALQEDLNIHSKPFGLLALGFLAAISACSTVQIPGTSPADIATIVAATQRAAPTWTPSPTLQPTDTGTPAVTPTPVLGTPVAPTRIGLLNGASSAVINGRIVPGETQAYAIRGRQAQPMLVHLDSPTGDASFSMMSEGGTFFVRPGTFTSWQGTLPKTGDYYLGVHGGSAPTTYNLSVQLVTRINFKEGASAATVSGNAPEGSIATYSVFGEEKERLVVTLSGAGRMAALSILGFANGHSYLSASAQKTTFTFTLPVTQDYIIEIVPKPGKTIDYILDVQAE